MRIKPKKRLGQNFLTDKNIRRKIIDSLELIPTDIILEIGAGRGEISEEIASRGIEKIYALEIDSSLCEILKRILDGHTNAVIINQDILKFDFAKYFKGLKKSIKVVGNIPYYISTPIIEQLVKFRMNIGKVFITVQKEFAQRIVAPAGSKEYGSLSCFVQYYSQPKIILNIKKDCFTPVPGVDSSLLRMVMKKKLPLKIEQEKLFFKIVRAAFNKRRKTLRNSLEGIVPKDKLNQFFTKYGIDCNTRPEDLSQQDFLKLVKFA